MYSDLSPKAKAFVPPAPKTYNRFRNKKKEYVPIPPPGFTGTNVGNIKYISNPFHMPYVTPNLYKFANVVNFSYFSK